jgi:hypothetical protein
MSRTIVSTAPAMPAAPVPRPPIGAVGVIGDRRSAMLVTADGSLNWLCLPKYHSRHLSVSGSALRYTTQRDDLLLRSWVDADPAVAKTAWPPRG